jgi:L-ascorbate metabolism protein UlaG (beta-lactamase superfamily)
MSKDTSSPETSRAQAAAAERASAPTLPSSPAEEPGGHAAASPTATSHLTWLGHATALAELGTTRLLFDPFGRGRTRRAGTVDAVLITHSHVDHLNRWSLRAVPRSAHLVVPRGARAIVADLGFSAVTEVTAGDQLQIGGAEIEAVATCHDTGRWRKTALPECVGYVVRAAAAGAPALHHAGDVDFSDHSVFDAIGKRFSLAATLLPVGGMMPVWYYRMRRRALDRGVHIDPDCALDIFERLGAKAMVPVHWGTLNLRLGLPSMPRRRVAAQARIRQLAERLAVLGHGERLRLKPDGT